MAEDDPAPDLTLAGLVTRAPEEIARVLGVLAARGEPLRANIGGGELAFTSRLRLVDPGRAFILLEPGADEAANAALLARPRASFRASVGTMHVEFAAADPLRAQHEGRSLIRLRFPDVMATKQQRAHERRSVEPRAPLRFVADAGGVLSFDGQMIDISEGGIGLVCYSSGITLEPGTVLTGCRIEVPGRAPVTVDLEVRYSCPVALPDGTPALHSGCRFVNPTEEVKALLAAFFRR